MNLIQKLFALKSIPPFNELRDTELGLIAKVALERSYKPGQIIAGSGSALSNLLVVVNGALWGEENQPLPQVIGETSLLFDLPININIRSAPETGADCLLISKGHFFTILNECPAFVIKLMELIPHENLYETPAR